MAQPADLASLEAQHKSLEQQINDEIHRPLPDQAHLTELKREKLKVKEEIAIMQGELHTA